MKISAEIRWPIAGALTALLLTPVATLARDAGTVNSYTPAEERRARNAAIAAGYTPGEVLFVHAGDFFLNATKDGHRYELTVVPSGEVYAGATSD